MLVVGQNSWANVNEADAYLKVKINTTLWFGLASSPSQPGGVAKESLLISAFNWLMSSPEIQLSTSLTDTDIKNAQIEFAWYLYKYGDTYEERRMLIDSGVKNFKFSKRSESFITASELMLPKYILAMLKAYNTQNTTIQLKGEYDG